MRSRRADEEGAALVEFAIVVPLLILLLCGTLDFGLIFGGYQSMVSGVDSAARGLSLNAYEYGGSDTCTGGPSTDTAYAVCNVVDALGPLTGLKGSSLAVGICFAAPGAALSCAGQSGPGTSISDDVIVCAQAQMQSTTGLTSVFVNGSTVYTSSRALQEEPQPSNTTAFDAYNASSTSEVVYNGNDVAGLTCT